MNRTLQILTETATKAAEWLEMADNPDRLLSGILANEIAKRDEYIEYLKRRLGNEGINSGNGRMAGIEKI